MPLLQPAVLVSHLSSLLLTGTGKDEENVQGAPEVARLLRDPDGAVQADTEGEVWDRR